MVVACVVCPNSLRKSEKGGLHSQLPDVGSDLGVRGVPGTSNTSSSKDFANPLGFTGNGCDLFRASPFSSPFDGAENDA